MREIQPPSSERAPGEGRAAASLDEPVAGPKLAYGGALPAVGGAPGHRAPTASEQAYGGEPLHDKQAQATAGPETGREHIREFEQMTEHTSKFADAPKQVTLPMAAQRGLQESWEASKADHHAKERGGNLVRDVHNGHMTSFAWRPGKAVKDDTFLPDPDDVGKDQTVVATGHTHGYANGTENVSFSGDDIAGLVDESQHMDLMQSGRTRYMVARTAEFDARLKGLDDDQLTALRNQITTTWNTAFEGEGTISQRAERASVGTCRLFKLAYYRGEGGTLNRIV